MSEIISKEIIFNDINIISYIDNHDIEQWENEVLRTIYDISWRNRSFYRELFYFYPNTMTYKQLSKKFLFKINQIIQFECQKAPFSIKITAQNDQRENSPTLIENNDSFLIKLEISFIVNNNEIIHRFKASLLWIEKNLLNGKFTSFSHITEAIDAIGKINKRDFWQFPNGKQFHLLNFLQGMLEKISPDFLIDFMGENVTKQLSWPSESKYKVLYRQKEAFIFEMEKDEIYFLRKDADPSRWQKQKIAATKFMTSQSKTFEKWKMIAKILRINFAKMWNCSDSFYEVVKTANHLFEMFYGQEFTGAVFITSSFPLKTQLADLRYKNSNENELNFQWYFNSYNFKFEIFNMEFSTIKINPKKDFYE